MSILSIESVYQDSGNFYITAVIDEMVQTHSQTQYDPAEYGSALCEASFSIDDELAEVIETYFKDEDNEQELIQFLEQLDLDWQLVDNSDDYFE